MNKFRVLALSLLLLLPSLAIGQGNVAERDTKQAVVSGTTLKFDDAHGTLTQSFEVLVTGTAPATLTISISGCMRGGTCNSTPVATSTGTANQLLVPLNPALYDYYSASVAWTGGSGTTRVTLNRTGTVAKSGGGQVPFNNVTSGTNTATLTEGAAGSIAPDTTTNGQVVANQLWEQPGFPVPTITSLDTGGNIGSGQQMLSSYTLNSALGETLGSLQSTSHGTCSTAFCTIIINSPSSIAGYTGWTAYYINTSNFPGTAPQRVLACTNIAFGANCSIVLSTLNSAVALPTISTAIVQPPNLQVGTCVTGGQPFMFTPQVGGNWMPQAVIDTQAYAGTPSSPDGFLSFCRPTFFNDAKSTQSFKNALLSVTHLAGATTNIAVQDRGIGVNLFNAVGDNITHYGMEAIQAETDCKGGATEVCGSGNPDGEVTVFSGQMSYANTAGTGCGTLGCTSSRLNTFLEAGAKAPSNGLAGLFVRMQNNSTVNGASAFLYGIKAELNNNAAAVSLGGIVYQAAPAGAAGANRLPNSNYGYYSQNFGNNAADWDLVMQSASADPASGRSYFGGNVYLPNIVPTGGTVAITGSVSPQAITTAQLTGNSNGSATPSGTVGTTTYTYKAVALDSNGAAMPTGSVFSTTTGNNILDGTNFNILAVAVTQIPQGTASMAIYRTVCGGAGICGTNPTGLIGNVVITNVGNPPASGSYGRTIAFNDTGLAGDGRAIPVSNVTGGITSVGYVLGTLNTKRVASNFTTAANTALQTITGLSWTTPTLAGNYSFHCSLAYSQATAAVAVAFGIQAATINPTNIFATGSMWTSTTALTTGILPTLATTSATAIVSATPSATATNFKAELDGTIELPAGENTVNVMVSTATSGDAVTVLKGSYCHFLP